MRRFFFILTLFVLFKSNGMAQQAAAWKFAHISDTHIGNETAVSDLQRTIADINNNPEISFVVITGDITEFGADEELRTAKGLLDQLKKPWYIIPGNHDMNWSESGGNSFRTVFGSETFALKTHGYLFLGTNCGPNMRMGPGQVPRENIVWLDSVLKATPKTTPVIFFNHYPQDSSLNNWYEIIDRLKRYNTQLIICGHGHSNHHLDFEGIPGIMGRSNLRAKDSIGGYNIVTIKGDSLFYAERTPGVATRAVWTSERLYRHQFNAGAEYSRPSYAVNKKFSQIKEIWHVEDMNDIGSGAAVDGSRAIVADAAGIIKAYNTTNGKVLWTVKTGGKIYSTPCIANGQVFVACTDKYLYCLDEQTGAIEWKAQSTKPVVASPVTAGGRVFCGSSDGHFKCFDAQSGKELWDFDKVSGFVETRPLLYNGRIYFGSWGNHLYALDQKTGSLTWNWNDGYTNRMFSPANCVPVAAGGRLFIVAPDRYMTCFDAASGKIIWRKGGDPQFRVRESMGLSADSSLVLVKTMDGDVLGIDSKADAMAIKWKGQHNLGYEISPTVISEVGGLVFAPDGTGNIYAFKRTDGSFCWAHKISNCLINPLAFLSNHRLIASTMDGKLVCLKYQ